MSNRNDISTFDPFGDEEDDELLSPPIEDGVPWSTEEWVDPAVVETKGVDSTFDSTTLFDFSANGDDPQETQGGFLFPEDPLDAPGKEPTVQVAIKEQLACLYDEFSNSSSGRVDGSIHVRCGPSANPFCLVVRDDHGHIDSFREDSAVCHDITFNVDRKLQQSVRTGDRVFRVTMSPNKSKASPLATYVCDSALRPIPMLVKTKVYINKGYCKVGIKIRSNPSNKVPLTNLAILLAVPPDLNGETVKISEHAGIWDGMKRVIAWSMDGLDPGDIIELQCQFEFVVVPGDDASKRPLPRFPILVRSEAVDEQLSDIEVSTDYTDHLSSLVKMNLSRSVSILHRKV